MPTDAPVFRLPTPLPATPAAAPRDDAIAARMRLLEDDSDLLRGYLFAAINDWHAAEDLFQELSLIVLRAATVPDESAFAAWCRGVARNLVRRHFRRLGRSRECPHAQLAEVVDTAYAEADAAREALAERQRLLTRCIDALPVRVRALLRAAYVDGLTSNRIGALFQRSAAAVRVTLQRARKALEDCVRRQQVEDGP